MKNHCAPSFLGTLLLLAAAAGCSRQGQTITVSSPSGVIKAFVFADSSRRLAYTVQYNGKTIVAPSALGITVGGTDLGENVETGKPDFSITDTQYPWKGVHAVATNHYREVIIPLNNASAGIRYQLAIRVFDRGLAFRYIVPGKGIFTVQGEASSWNIPKGSTVWYQENIFYYEGIYQESSIAKLKTGSMGPPVTYQTPDSLYASISEAALYNYSGMSLRSDSSGIIHAAFVNDPRGWQIRDTIITPWRVLIAGSSLNELVNADIIPDLNPPPDSSLQNAKWIRPGRAVWSYFMHDNVTTPDLEKSYVDKAALLGFEYSVVDAGWESSWPASLDSLRALVDYAKPKQVGIWVWKSYASLKDDSVRRHFFNTLHAIGVAGVKIDFIDTEGIAQVRFYEKALKDAAADQLMIDFHGANKPTGYNRTHPNELTREGIHGQEWRTYNPQGPVNNAIIPFTRFLVGPGDYTPGVFNSKKAYGTSRAQQLALPVIYNSPLACWPDDPETYLASPALPVIKAMPTVWDETRVLAPSRIGKLAAFARRKGSDWFIGIINAGQEKRFWIPLGFLGKGKFVADIFQDDLTDPDHLLHSESVYTNTDSLLIVMRPAGGYTAMLRKTDDAEPGLSISPQGGYLYAPIPVSIKTNAGFDIRYTTDGTEPSAHAALYEKPFTIGDPMLLRAKSFKAEKPFGASGTAQFLYAPAPVLSDTGSIFIDKKLIGMEADDHPGDIHYTLDGSTPTSASPLYRDSLRLAKTTLVKARTFFASGTGSAVATAFFEQSAPHPSLQVQQAAPGLQSAYYEGKWNRMPDFTGRTALRSAVVAIPDLNLIQTNKDHYAIRFSGYINIPATGIYSFYINSDDGSQLYLDDRKLIDNDGAHGDLEKSGDKALSAGMHRFTVNYFQNEAGQNLQVYMRGPSHEKQIIPPSLFFHSNR